MLKFIKNLSMLSTTLESLHSADAIESLIDFLSYSMRKDHLHFREISNQVLNTMFNLCRLNKERQEDAAVGGIIPLLLKIMKTDRPPKEFVLPILCDMAHSGRTGRRYLWQNKGLDFYVSLLADQYWQVTALDAVLVWLQEETANVESHLIDGSFAKAIVSCFNTNKLNAFDSNLLEPLLKLLRLSPSVAASLAVPEMFAGIAQRLGHKKAVVRLNLLRLVRIIMDACEPDSIGLGNGSSTLNTKQVQSLLDAIRTLAENDSAVLVKNLASELVKSRAEAAAFLDGMSSTASVATQQGPGGPARRSGSGARRNTSYTPPGLHSSMSMPPTPTHSGPRNRSSQSVTYIEVAASPRRAATHERDALLYRPRSRDGATAIPRRVSGDASGSINSIISSTLSNGSSTGSGSVSKSRLPRTSSHMARVSGGSHHISSSAPIISRSESSMSNKENAGRVVPGTPVSSSAAASAAHVERGVSTAGVGKRRTRAPSSDLKWA
jgi:hypothetical protein